MYCKRIVAVECLLCVINNNFASYAFQTCHHQGFGFGYEGMLCKREIQRCRREGWTHHEHDSPRTLYIRTYVLLAKFSVLE